MISLIQLHRRKPIVILEELPIIRDQLLLTVPPLGVQNSLEIIITSRHAHFD